MAKQHKIINKHLNSLDLASNKLQYEMNNISILQEFTLISITASNLIHNLKRTQDMLLDILTNVHPGQLNIHLLTPEQLQKELTIISAHVSDDVTIPTEHDDLKNLYSLLSIKTRFTQQYFIFQITFPLVSRDRYNLYKIHPIPHEMNNTMIEYIPSSEYIATDLQRDSYLSLNSAELNKCVQQKDIFFCNMNAPIYHISEQNQFCGFSREISRCKVRISACEDRWTPLNNPSNFLYHCCGGKCSWQIICNQQRLKMKSMKTTGLLHLDPGCCLKGPNFKLHVPEIYSNEMKITSSVLIPEIDELNNIINTSMTIAIRAITPLSLNLSDSIEIEKEFNKLHKRIDDLKSQQLSETPLSSHDVHQYSVSYSLVVLVGAAAVAGSVWLCRRHRERAQRALINTDIEMQPVTSNRAREIVSLSNLCVSARVQSISDTVDFHNPSVSVPRPPYKTDQACSPLPRTRHLRTVSPSP